MPTSSPPLHGEPPPLGLPSAGQIGAFFALPLLTVAAVCLIGYAVSLKARALPGAAGLSFAAALGCGLGWFLAARYAPPQGQLHDLGQVLVAAGTLGGLAAGTWLCTTQARHYA